MLFRSNRPNVSSPADESVVTTRVASGFRRRTFSDLLPWQVDAANMARHAAAKSNADDGLESRFDLAKKHLLNGACKLPEATFYVKNVQALP